MMGLSQARFVSGLIVIAQSLLLLVPLAILGAAISWPDSLDFPPSQALPLIFEQIGQVRLGYGIYLAYSLAWVIVGPIIAWAALGRNGSIGTLFVTAIGLICASALARAIGIIRWLTASSFLAESYGSATPEARAAIDVVQSAINAWGGAIGELLGVSLFTVGWLIAVSVLVLRHGGLPKFIGWSGLIVAPILASPAIELFGMEANLSLPTMFIQGWLFVVGIALLWQAWSGSRG
jgi:hypothetical protein